MGTRPGPRHRFGAHDAAVRAPEQPQLAFDHAARRAEIQVAPALDAVVMHGQARAGLPAARAHPAPAAQPHGHDHPLAGEADIDDRCSGQAEQPVECRGDAHVALLAGPLILTTSSLPPGAAARRCDLRNVRRLLIDDEHDREQALRGDQAATSPTSRPETLKSGGDNGAALVEVHRLGGRALMPDVAS